MDSRGPAPGRTRASERGRGFEVASATNANVVPLTALIVARRTYGYAGAAGFALLFTPGAEGGGGWRRSSTGCAR